jgi:RimJ/RimL family protein N-acetyltransferase
VYDHRDGSRTVEFEVMFKLGRAYWGHGYATELAEFWLDFAFREVRLPQVLVCPLRANHASVMVLERLGAEFEDDWLDEAVTIARFTQANWFSRAAGR